MHGETGRKFSLPSEVEWEYAARGGLLSKGYKYAGSDDPEKVAWYGANSGDDTHLVGGKRPNELRLYNMSGNVWEWTRSLWGKDWTKPDFKYPYNPGDGREDLVTPENIFRVRRGGAFYGLPQVMLCAWRNHFHFNGRGSKLVFRVVVSPSDSDL